MEWGTCRQNCGLVLSVAIVLMLCRDIVGSYCTSRPGGCCVGRNDQCTAPGFSCFCDVYCNRSVPDCCPDYFTFCHGCSPIAHCVSGQCTSSGSICNSCDTGYISAGWNNGCQAISECASSPCQHGGTCSEPTVNGYTCTCRSEFTGTNCEQLTPEFCYLTQNAWTQWSACDTSCGGGLRQRQCVYNGQHGMTDKEECGKVCLNQGDYYGSRCHCRPGTTGTCCTDIGDCNSQPCKNGGNCTDEINMYSCTCPAGTVQPHCDDILECSSNPCQNGGTCHEFVNDYTCDCIPGTTGPTCTDIDDCASSPCLNGGVCMEHVGAGVSGYSCQCPAGTTGSNCQDIPECLSSPCQNGGICNEMVNMYNCTCTTRFTGSTCEKNLFAPNDHVCISGACYFVFQVKDTWQGAKEFCEARLGHLLVPKDLPEELYVENYVNSMKVQYPDEIFWIGGTKSGTSSPHWVTGFRSSVYRWPSGVSDNVAGNQCLAMDGGYGFMWQAFPCDRKSHFICQEMQV